MKLKREAMLALLTCGVAVNSLASQEISTFIYNGANTSAAEWPSIAGLYYESVDDPNVYGQFCTATILDNRHVMTAAHCLYYNGNLDEEVMVFTSVAPQLNSSRQFASSGKVRGQAFYIHPNYVDSSDANGIAWPNDIAIIQLEEAMNVSAFDYVELGQSMDSFNYRIDGEPLVAVGYGVTETGSSGELLKTQLNYEPSFSCDLGASDSQICTSGEFNNSTNVRNAICSGDSGGPLYWFDGSEYKQVGISSYGWIDCYESSSDDTSVFTEVADYSSWIASVIAGNETPNFTVTAEQRDQYEGSDDFGDRDRDRAFEEIDRLFSVNDSSGGSTSLFMLLCLTAIGFARLSVRS
ncbi:hypothetical protein BIY21_19760 [Vibrio ponticus]|uniref:Serine protease n=1 Tax=Vibrio ponticus TaxID=265668 RepID=A0A3N3DTS4_9VIBR|nr:serine protease [Vibrio ponticus]OLQ84748.1 hypothetical protein BIY21_19760 [Vibrio ponticus]ROV57880.1 serine protease [Vibrio ponticus]